MTKAQKVTLLVNTLEAVQTVMANELDQASRLDRTVDRRSAVEHEMRLFNVKTQVETILQDWRIEAQIEILKGITAACEDTGCPDHAVEPQAAARG